MIFAIALFVLRKWKINPILVMSLCGVSRIDDSSDCRSFESKEE